MTAEKKAERMHNAFPETEWDMVEAATGPHCESSSLGRLLEAYLPSLELYIFGQFSIPPDQAKDLVQSFILHKIIEKDLLQNADRERGRFRNFLIRSLHNFVIEQLRREAAAKRSPSHSAIPIHELPENCLTELKLQNIDQFDVAWARDLLIQTLRLMKDECFASGKQNLWGVFEARLLNPLLGEVEPQPYEELVIRYRFDSIIQAANTLITAKRMFARHVRALIAQYVKDERAIDLELLELKNILSRVGADLGPPPRNNQWNVARM